MDFEALRQLDAGELAEYLWKRLRREVPMDPPLGSRFGDEEPEQFVIQAAKQGNDRAFRNRLVEAIGANFSRLAEEEVASQGQLKEDSTADEHVASLAFMISELEMAELVERVYRFLDASLVGPAAVIPALTFGQTHLLRTLAQLQAPGLLAAFWRTLWERGPRSLRGLTIFGWVRSVQDEALKHLGELADSANEIDLPGAMWSLVGRQPGVIAVAKAVAANCSAAQRDVLGEALVEAGAEQPILRDFDLHSRTRATQSTGFQWTHAGNVPARGRPRWGRAA